MRSLPAFGASLAILAPVLAGCGLMDRLVSGDVLQPEPGIPLSPHALGLPAEEVHFRTASGKRLHGWFIPCAQPKGAIFVCKGSMGNALWFGWPSRALHEAGLQVFIFDYAGFGLSEGPLSLRGLWEDTRAAWVAFRALPGLREDRIGVFGISLGAPLAYQTMAEHAEVRTGVFESLFDPQADMYRLLPSPWLRRMVLWTGAAEGIDLEDWTRAIGDRPVLFNVPSQDFLRFPLERVWTAGAGSMQLWWILADHYPFTYAARQEEYAARVAGHFLNAFEKVPPPRVLSWSPGGPTSDKGPDRLIAIGDLLLKGVLPAEGVDLALPRSAADACRRWKITGQTSAGWRTPAWDIEVLLESRDRTAVEVTLLSGKVDGTVAGWTRAVCGPGRTVVRVPSCEREPDGVALCVVDGTERPVRERKADLEIDLTGPSGDPRAEAAWLSVRIREASLSPRQLEVAVSRLAHLRLGPEGPPTYERACLALTQADPGLTPPLLDDLYRRYPDFRTLLCRDALEAFPSWLETNRGRLRKSGDRHILGPKAAPEVSLFLVGSAANTDMDLEVLADGRPLAPRRSESGDSRRLPRDTRRLSLRVGDSEMSLELPAPLKIRNLFLDLDALFAEQGAWLGVLTATLENDLTVYGAEGPASAAGLRTGDVLLSIDGVTLPDLGALRREIVRRRPGDAVLLAVRREGEPSPLLRTATLGRCPADTAMNIW